MSAWLAMAGAVMLGGGVPSASIPVASPVRDAPATLGWDWMESWAPTGDDPTPWPRADSAATGVQDAIESERETVARIAGGGVGEHRGLGNRINRLSGGYIVVPVLTVRLR